MDFGQNHFKLMPPASSQVPSQRPLALISCPSRLSANDKGDNEMISGAVHRSPGVYLTAEENPGNLN